MALTDERIAELRDEACKIAPLHRSAATPFARSVEAEVRKQDAALIQQLVEALESIDDAMPFPVARQVLKVARARMSPPPIA